MKKITIVIDERSVKLMYLLVSTEYQSFTK